MSKPKTMAGRKMVSLPPELWERIDDYRFGNRINTESEAIRRLLTKGLASEALEDLVANLVHSLRPMMRYRELSEDERTTLFEHLKNVVSKSSKARALLDVEFHDVGDNPDMME